MSQRYEVAKDPHGLYQIVDKFTGQPVNEYGVLLVGLLADEAVDVVSLLNAKDLRDRKAKGIA